VEEFLSKKFILHRVGMQYIETEIPHGEGARAAAAPSYNSWEALEGRLLSLGAFPESVKQVKADFDAGKDTTSIEITDPGASTNELFLAVLPLVHVTASPYFGFGLTEQTLTLFPDRSFATQFFADEVDNYILVFQSRAEKFLLGGHSKRFEFFKEEESNGRVIVRVVQYVS
jgi:hypothetical protein